MITLESAEAEDSPLRRRTPPPWIRARLASTVAGFGILAIVTCALAPLVGELLGTERAAIHVSDDGLRHSVRVGDVIDFEIEDIVPFGSEAGRPVRFEGMFHPVASNLTMAEARRSRIHAFGIHYEGKTGLSTSQFSWAA